MWFGSYGGYSPTKTGKDRNYYAEAIRNVKNQLARLKNIKFSVRNYLDLKTEKMNNFLIYCDPPYAQNKSLYDDKTFNHEIFWEWVRKLSKNNHVFVSEYQAPKDFEIVWEKQLSKMFPAQKKDTPTEKLFVYAQ